LLGLAVKALGTWEIRGTYHAYLVTFLLLLISRRKKKFRGGLKIKQQQGNNQNYQRHILRVNKDVQNFKGGQKRKISSDFRVRQLFQLGLLLRRWSSGSVHAQGPSVSGTVHLHIALHTHIHRAS